MEIQVIEKTNGRINRVTGTTIKERLRVCAYCRVSTDNEEQLNSYQSQLKYYDDNYNIETKEITINEDEANIVRYMFERYVEGIGSSTIAKELTAKDIKTPKGGTKWCESTIRGILKNWRCSNGKNIYNRSNIT